MFAHEPAETATEREARHAGDRDEAAGGGEAVRLERVVHLTPVASPLSADRQPQGINRDAFHVRQVDHEAVIAHGEAGDVVTGAADGNEQFLHLEVVGHNETNHRGLR
jgi:hypothetical protein